jgi:hypothetical protein
MDENDLINASKQTTLRSEYYKEKNEKSTLYTYEKRSLDFCGVCRQKYNVGDRIPRILINCGHTYCTSCLTKYHHKNKVRCPLVICKKLVKNVDNIEQLPLNIEIFGEIVGNSIKLHNFIQTDTEESYLRICKLHSEKQKHFYCSLHDSNFCRECIKSYHRDIKCCIVDICDIRKIYHIHEEIKHNNYLLVKARMKKNSKKRTKEEFSIINN